MTGVTRRHVLEGAAAGAVFAPAVLVGHGAKAALPPLPDLPAGDALLLRPGDANFAQYQPAFNARTMLTPQLRALCKTATAVGAWSIGAAAMICRSRCAAAGIVTKGFRKAPAS